MDGQYKPVSDCIGEEISEEDAKNGVQPKAIYYVSDEVQQAQYIAMFKDASVEAVLCDTLIDPHFISYIEYKNPQKCRFVRIDADIDGALKGGAIEENEFKDLVETFKSKLKNSEIAVKVERFKSGKIPAIINVEEFMRRMSEMSTLYGMNEANSLQNATLVLARL